MDEQWFTFPGINPEPWEVGPINVIRRNNKYIPFVGRSQQLEDYKLALREAIKDQSPRMMTGNLALACWFWRQLPEFVTAAQRRARKHVADDTNLVKATEDALQGIVFDNDRNNVHVQGFVVAQGPEVTPGIIIQVKHALTPVEMMMMIPTPVFERLAPEPEKVKEPDRYSTSNPADIF